MFTSNNFIVYVQVLLSDIIHERKYKINDGDRICYDFCSSYVNFNFELTGEGAADTESNVSHTIASQKNLGKKKLGELTEKFRQLVAKSGGNITLPQSGNLADQLRNLTQSGGFKKLSQLLPELSELGINETAIKDLQQKGSTDLPGIVQKLKDLLQAVP